MPQPRSTNRFPEILSSAVARGTFERLVLSRPDSSWKDETRKITVRPVGLASGVHFQWAVRRGSQEFHENLSLDDFLARVQVTFPARMGDAHLFTTEEELSAKRQPDGGVRLKRGASRPDAVRGPASATGELASPAEHNRARAYLLRADQPIPFLVETGVQAPSGEIKPTMSRKFRQINRYLEFVRDVLDVWPADRTLRIVDFGCGKSYLTFALHHYLTSVCGRDVEILGLDLKPDVVAHCEQLARQLACEGLRFERRNIADQQLSGPVDLAISLHACDTATDEAIAAALSWQAQVIFAVPCCQHELNQSWPTHVWPGLTGYGLLRERVATLATDALRARYLDAAGYETQVAEFIALEHTPKNVLIRAVRRESRDLSPAVAIYHQLKHELGVQHWALERACQRRGLAPLGPVPNAMP